MSSLEARILKHIPEPKVSDNVNDWPKDEQDLFKNVEWRSFTERSEHLTIYRRKKIAKAILKEIQYNATLGTWKNPD